MTILMCTKLNSFSLYNLKKILFCSSLIPYIKSILRADIPKAVTNRDWVGSQVEW